MKLAIVHLLPDRRIPELGFLKLAADAFDLDRDDRTGLITIRRLDRDEAPFEITQSGTLYTRPFEAAVADSSIANPKKKAA